MYFKINRYRDTQPESIAIKYTTTRMRFSNKRNVGYKCMNGFLERRSKAYATFLELLCLVFSILGST